MPPAIVMKVSAGLCTFGHQSQDFRCYCQEGWSFTGAEALLLCRQCGHLMSLHRSHPDSPIQNPAPTAARARTRQWDDFVCRREDTVAGLLKLLLRHRVVQVRGTPTSGKTILSELLHDHIQSTMPHLISVYIVWRHASLEDFAKDPRYIGYKEWLRALSNFALPADYLDRDVVLIIDEAQLSYTALDFWVDLVKKQAQSERGPYLALFSSFGSAGNTALNIEGTAPITLEQYQRVSLTPQPQIQVYHDISLCFTLIELRDVCTRITKGRFHIDEDIVKRIFLLTNGHPGLCCGLLRSLVERPASRSLIKAGKVIHLEDVADFFDSKSLFRCIEERVRRSLPNKTLNDPACPNIKNALRSAVAESGIVTRSLNTVPGLASAYRRGYLQAEMVDDGLIAYLFPSELHKRYCQSLVRPDSSEIPFLTVSDLCFAAIRHFSPRHLQDHVRKAKHSGIKYAQNQVCQVQVQASEAQYADELHRCLHEVTDWKCNIYVEFSYDGDGRIDFLLTDKSKSWGIEVLRNGDRLQQHLDQFGKNGRCGSWDARVVKDWILLDFRQSEPNPKTTRNEPHLFKVIFTPDNESVRIWDSNHNEVIPLTELTYM